MSLRGSSVGRRLRLTGCGPVPALAVEVEVRRLHQAVDTINERLSLVEERQDFAERLIGREGLTRTPQPTSSSVLLAQRDPLSCQRALPYQEIGGLLPVFPLAAFPATGEADGGASTHCPMDRAAKQ